tara:strand:+ start:2790 stop:3746 length:957 start_codon:yes stop_codon:yes gene_type:complete
VTVKKIKSDDFISIIIPVFNSENIVKNTVEQSIYELKSQNLNFEIILINDGSKDNSWRTIKKLTQKYPEIISINLLKNYGQHTAIYCGIEQSKGNYLVTLDDDLQNPPKEIIKLINKITDGYDVVFGTFPEKKHSFLRKIGTLLINYLNKKIFNKPKSIKLTNFRIFTREVAERIKNYNTLYPYIPGLLLMFSSSIANVETLHEERKIGKSNYTIIKIIKLVSRLLFNYSSYPLKVLSSLGIIISILSFSSGIAFIVNKIYFKNIVPGWTTIVVIISFFNGFLIFMLGILGEYVSRILSQVSFKKSYQINEICSYDGK